LTLEAQMKRLTNSLTFHWTKNEKKISITEKYYSRDNSGFCAAQTQTLEGNFDFSKQQ